ncbi:uncharacterized protein LOC105261523 [Musca domestica]|uniref:Uncharacterized protein LOC105261523 n=1 Tax=Musca domestica TaxID=7370 RepID=A0A9J7I7Z1_MUSDO|nr:uncharacterized protein LOC105261523 [Musca domestica]
MLQITIFSLAFCVLLTAHVINGQSANNTALQDPEIQEALQFSQSIVNTAQSYIQYDLPIEARPEGEVILAQVKQGLAKCEALVDSVLNIWEYKQCASILLRDAMAALSSLQGKYRPYLASSASRPSLFW